MKPTFREKSKALRYALKESGRSMFSPTVTTQVCPICGGRRSMEIKYGRADFITGPSAELPEAKAHSKYRCHRCGHLYSHWLDADLEQVGKVTGEAYDNGKQRVENYRAAYQLGLQRYLLAQLGHPARAALLDFGCGPNLSPTMTLREEGHDARCCDIMDYRYDGEIFFRHTNDPARWRQFFDGIVSIDVIEHLGNALETFTYFNRILKPGGYMAGCFPTQYHYQRGHSYFRNPYHVCLLSPTSLRILCRKTGFSLLRIEPFEADVPHVFLFQKTREA
jgi:SAM-dependent methyltransferase